MRTWLDEKGGITISPKSAKIFSSESEAKIEIERIKKLFKGLNKWEVEIVNT